MSGLSSGLSLATKLLGTGKTAKNIGLAAGGVGGSAFLANVFRGNKEQREVEEDFGFGLEDVVRGREASRHQMMKMERVRAMQQANIERLAALRPDLYNQIVAGRRLPRGGSAIGGVPNLELLQSVAASMGGGGELTGVDEL